MNEITKKILVSVATSVIPLAVKGTASLVKKQIDKKKSTKFTNEYSGLYTATLVDIDRDGVQIYDAVSFEELYSITI